MTDKQKAPLHPILKKLEIAGNLLVDSFHLIALFVIGATIIWSAALEYIQILSKGGAGLKDILMLFIFLELGAMIGIYFKTKRLPVMFLIYIAITAITRVLAIDIKEMSDMKILSMCGAILILSISGYVLSLEGRKSTVKPDSHTNYDY